MRSSEAVRASTSTHNTWVLGSRRGTSANHFAGIKEYSDWPTIPQLYVEKEFVGGCDILMNMHRDGSLAQLLSEKKVILEEEEPVEGGHPSPP